MVSILVSSIRETVARLEASTDPWRGCPAKVGWYNLSKGTGAYSPMRCKRHRCSHCGPLNAHLFSLAIVDQAPTHALHLTLVGETWKVRRDRMKRFRYAVAKEGYPFEWAWHVEPNPRGTGHHVHALYRGKYMNARHVRSIAAGEGLGKRVTIEWLQDPARAANYNVKMLAASYGVKMLTGLDQDVFLDANGGRPVHASRGYWLRNRGLWAAVRAAQESTRGPPDPGPWISFRVSARNVSDQPTEVRSATSDVG